jgi:PadR family transcriptional regulator, regulatory protein AphA
MARTKSVQPRALAESSYAILGHLALRPWSAYELTSSVRRSLRWFWSRADSRIYSELRKLADLGLATAQQEGPSSRPRTCYSITDQGRQLLAQWLATPSSRFLLHFEPLLRVHLASHGTKEDLLRSLQEARDVAAEIRRVGTDVASDFITGRHVLQHDAHVRALVFDFLWSLSETIDSWADRSEQEVRQWPDLSLTDANRARAIDLMRQALARP